MGDRWVAQDKNTGPTYFHNYFSIGIRAGGWNNKPQAWNRYTRYSKEIWHLPPVFFLQNIFNFDYAP